MKRFKCFFLFWGSFLFCCFPASVFSQNVSNHLLKKLDSFYYYPQKNGLTGLVATVVLETKLSSDNTLKKSPPVKFAWNSVSDKRTFRVVDESLNVSEQEQKSLLQFFSNYKEVLLPQTLVQKFSRYSGKVSQGKYGTRLEFEINDFQEGMSRYSLFINGKLGNVSRMVIDRIEAPTKISGAFKYVKKNNRWLVSESVARFNLGNQSYMEKTRYYYARIENVWLVNRIDQTLMRENKKLSRYIFRIKDYLLNWSGD